MGFDPSQLCSGRTVPTRVFRGGGPRVVHFRRHRPVDFRRGIGRHSNLKPNRTKPDSLDRLLRGQSDDVRVRLLGFDPSVPAVWSAGRFRRQTVLPWALPLSGLPDASQRDIGGLDPAGLRRPSPDPVRAALRS